MRQKIPGTILETIHLQYLPADMHSHLRRGPMLRTTVLHSAWRVGYEAIEPNCNPIIVTTADARVHRKEIIDANRENWSSYRPILGVYLTKDSNPADIAAGYRAGEIGFVKWYPPHGTTASHLSVPLFSPHYCKMSDMIEREGIPFQHHGEVTHHDGEELCEDDRERYFYGEYFPQHRRRWPGIRFFGEHLSSAEGVYAILSDPGCYGTITPWHPLVDCRIRDRGGLNPLYAVKPALKRPEHTEALREALRQRSLRLFAGTDRAPHPRGKKSCVIGCACGIYSIHFVEWYATLFEMLGMLDYLENFLCINGPRAYGLHPIAGEMQLTKTDVPRYEHLVRFGQKRNDVIVPFGYHPNRTAPPDLRLPNYWYLTREW